MLEFKYKHTDKYFKSTILEKYFKGKKFCVFDIETAGLDPSKGPVVLCGFYEVNPDGTSTATQYFLDSLDDEYELLKKTIDKINEFDYIVTFNGRHFDIPYIVKRASLVLNKEIRIKPYNLDLYLVLNGHSSIKKILPNLKQKTVEIYMGLSDDRDDMISGAESVELYYSYLCCQEKEKKDILLNTILLHNHDDIVLLYKILPILKNCDIHKAMCSLGFPVFTELNLVINKIKLINSELIIEGIYFAAPFSYYSFDNCDDAYTLQFGKDGSFSLIIPIRKEKNIRFVDLKYYFKEIPSGLLSLNGFFNEYLVLEEKGKKCYPEINAFASEILEKISRDVVSNLQK